MQGFPQCQGYTFFLASEISVQHYGAFKERAMSVLAHALLIRMVSLSAARHYKFISTISAS
jgi:hypothetical protein